MSVYDYIFEFFYFLLWENDDQSHIVDLADFSFNIGNVSISFDEWLCHTFSIIVIILIGIFFIKLTIWFFKQGANFFKW